MNVSDFHFDLPPELIAQRPPARRSASRLLVLGRTTGAVADHGFVDLPQWLAPGDLLVLNDTRVIPARLNARKASGGRVEVLVERVLDRTRARVQLGASRKPSPGTRLRLDDGHGLRVVGREQAFWVLECEEGQDWTRLLERHGHVPLPPYIQRADQDQDRERYQTIYARAPGAVAAPTAGLHFDADVFRALRARGVERAWCTLHVGAGTFAPVRVDTVEDHQMHPEWLHVPAALVEAVARTRARGGRVVAVGTTSVRALETAGMGGALAPYCGDSRLFIYPGFRFQIVDAMVTNFHLPGSTLMMLVSAFAGRESILAAYRHAIAERYRFFSYGDAMLIL